MSKSKSPTGGTQGRSRGIKVKLSGLKKRLTPGRPTPAASVTIDRTPQKIYEDHHIEVFRREGSSRFSCVAFNEMAFTPTGHTFWAETLFRDQDLDGLGIVAKRPNWFPEVAIRQAIEKCRNSGKPTIAYGYSMGAYAALKWGALFGAECSLAYSPQYSIVPDDLGGQDRRYSAHLNPGLHEGMAIDRQDKACARNYVVVDPSHPLDVLNLRLIEANRTVARIHAWNLAHETMYAGKGSAAARMIMESVLRDDLAACKRLVRDGAKKTLVYKRELLRRLLGHRKHSQFSILASRFAEDLEGDAAFHRLMADHYRVQKSFAHALASITKAIELNPKNAAYRSCKISLLLQSGDLLAASAESEAAILEWPAAQPLQIAYVSVLHARGDVERARTYVSENEELKSLPLLRTVVRDLGCHVSRTP
jgi:hypothetical protein